MKIRGPGGPGQPPEIDEAGKTGKAEKTGFADKLGGADKPGGPSGPGGPGGPGGPDPVAAVASDLKAGKITPQQAVDRLMHLVVDQGAAAGAPEKVRAKIRADLERMLAEDPFLAGKAKRIGVSAPKPELEGDDE